MTEHEALLTGNPIYIETKEVQRRKHHKKRINKKWRKRYGVIKYDVYKKYSKEGNMKKITFVILITALLLCGCLRRESDKVSYNVSKEADNFNVTRRITVFNIRTDTVLLQMTGKFALQNNSHSELCIIAEVEKGIYQKHFIYLNEYTMYTVEDLNGTEVSPYAYELEFLPQQLIPVKITVNELKEDIKEVVE